MFAAAVGGTDTRNSELLDVGPRCCCELEAWFGGLPLEVKCCRDELMGSDLRTSKE